VLYTDGVTEAANAGNAQWSLDGLAEVVRENHELSPEQLIQRIVQSVTEFSGGVALVDDATVIVGRLD